MAGATAPRSLSERVYRLLLQLYPADHRREYGPFMLQLFRDMHRHAWQTGGILGVIRLWLRTLPDVAVSALREHITKETYMTSITFGQLTNIGMVRSQNEDIAAARFFPGAQDSDTGLLLVLDGLGGHANGGLASERARQVIEAHVEAALAVALTAEQTDPEAILADAFQAAHEAIRTDLPESGTCATALLIAGDRATIAHVGDSRAYLLANGDLTQLTTDHLTPPENGKLSLTLTRAMGMSQAALEVDIFSRTLPTGARVLLCSDGLWRMVDEAAIRSIIAGEDDPNAACDQLIAAANAGGGVDNIAALVVQVQ